MVADRDAAVAERETTPPLADRSTERRWLISRVLFYVGGTFLILFSLGFTFFTVMSDSLFQEGSSPWVYLVVFYVSYAVLPVILFVPALVPLAFTWRYPARIVVFRRFNTPQEARILRRIAARELARFGHVFTLADSQIHRPWWSRIRALLGQVSVLHFHQRRIVNARGVRRLQQSLARRTRLNIAWLVAFRKIFPVQSADACWQDCVRALLQGADVVVVDVSRFSEAMAWELSECERHGLLKRVIFLVSDEQREERKELLNGLVDRIGGRFDNVVFTYDGIDVLDRAGLRAEMARILSAHPGRSRAGTWQAMGSAVATFALSVGLTAAAADVVAPYLWPELAVRYSPRRSQVLTAYFNLGADQPPARLMSAANRDWTMARLREEAVDGEYRGRAMSTLAEIGDITDIPMFVRLSGARGAPEDKRGETGFWAWFRARGTFEGNMLMRLVKRLGPPALAPLMQAVAAAPALPFDGELYYEYIQPNAPEPREPVFRPLLDAPSQAARFMAAIELAPTKNPRTIPVLLEVAHGYDDRYDLGEAGGALLHKHFEGQPVPDTRWLDPFILGADRAAEAAVALAFGGGHHAYLASVLDRATPGSGGQLLKRVVQEDQDSDPARARRARLLIAHASPAWTRSFPADADLITRASAAYVRAVQGDASVSQVLRALSKESTMCELILGLRYECQPHIDIVNDALTHLSHSH